MKILLSNDDGVFAPGLSQLFHALSELADVVVVAPEADRSAAGKSLTINAPLRVRRLENGFMSVNGTPTDCVHLALSGGLHIEADMVVAGINAGCNLSDDVLYSGTVAIATEGRFLGYPGIAVSLDGEQFRHYDTAAQITKQIILQIQQNPLPPSTILNVNVPDLPLAQIKGIKVTRLGQRHQAENTLQASDPRGRTIYWIGPPGAQQDADQQDTDFYALRQGYVSVTPLQVDLTHYALLPQLTEWVGQLSLADCQRVYGEET